jgi:hypothetical protein
MSEHGTIAAYTRHRRADESPCDPCKAAWNTYQSEYKRAHPENRPRENRYAAARSRALQQLRREYPQRFNELFAAEKRRDADGGRPIEDVVSDL